MSNFAITCEKCQAQIEIMPPNQWSFEEYATCPRCGHATQRSVIIRELAGKLQRAVEKHAAEIAKIE